MAGEDNMQPKSWRGWQRGKHSVWSRVMQLGRLKRGVHNSGGS